MTDSTIATPIVLVTGARGGIGRSLCTQLHAQGWRVAAVGRDAALLVEVPAAARIAADTTTPEGAAAAVAACTAQLGAPTHLAHCVGNTLIAAVLVSSVVAQIGVANHEAIAAAKAGIEGLVRSAAATYAAQGLRINAVAPGMTDTPLTAGMLKLPAMREGAGRQYPLGGVQTADQVAQAMAWLLSDAASRITGHVLPVDGGFTHVRPLVK
ncbi:MAG: hypothetical protein Fur0019_15910 [Tibeticola sp.]